MCSSDLEEKSLIVIEKGKYLGFGFFNREESIENIEVAKGYIKPSKDNRVVQNLVNSYLMKPKSNEIIPL